MKHRLALFAILSVMLVLRGTAQSRSIALPEGHEFTSPDHMPISMSADGT